MEGCQISLKMHEAVWFNGSVTRGGWVSNFQKKDLRRFNVFSVKRGWGGGG